MKNNDFLCKNYFKVWNNFHTDANKTEKKLTLSSEGIKTLPADCGKITAVDAMVSNSCLKTLLAEWDERRVKLA